MTEPVLARDNLFQLNCLIWATFPQPKDAPVTPLLRNAGYILWAVEQPLPSSFAELAGLKAANVKIEPNPVADVVFHRAGKKTYTFVECKPSSFGVESGSSPQARGLIMAGGNVPSRLGLSGKQLGEVCYLVPADDAKSVDATLIEIRKQMDQQGFAGCPTGPLGLSIKDDGVYLGSSNQPSGAAQMPLALVPERRLLRVNPDESPNPLFVIPWIPDATAKGASEAFKEKLRAQILGWLGNAPLGGPDTISFDDLLNKVTRGVFQNWRDRASLTGRVFPKVKKIIEVLFDHDSRTTVSSRAATATLMSETDRGELMEKVRTAALPARLPEGEQLHLLGESPGAMPENG